MPRKSSTRANKQQRRTAFLIHYDGYIQVLAADSLNPEEEFDHVNDVASRLVKERLHGDVLIVLPDPIPWLATLDADTMYTSEQLLTLARRHSPVGLGRVDGNQSPQPPIKTLLITLQASNFLPEFQTLQAIHDHANCGDSCRHLAYLPRHSAVQSANAPRRRSIRDTLNAMEAAAAQPATRTLTPVAEASVQAAARALTPAYQPPVKAPPRVLIPGMQAPGQTSTPATQAPAKNAPFVMFPGMQARDQPLSPATQAAEAPAKAAPIALTPSIGSLSATEDITKDAQMAVPKDSPPVYVTANSVMPSLSGESSSTVMPTVAVDVPMTDEEVTSSASSLYHASKRPSTDHFGGMSTDLSNGDVSVFLNAPGAASDDDRAFQKRLRRDEPAATCESREPRLSEAGSDSVAAIDGMHCSSHDLLLDSSVLDGTSSLSPREPGTDIQSYAPMATDAEEVEEVLPNTSVESYAPMDSVSIVDAEAGAQAIMPPDAVIPTAPAPTADTEIEEWLPRASSMISTSPVPTAAAEGEDRVLGASALISSSAPVPTAAAESEELPDASASSSISPTRTAAAESEERPDSSAMISSSVPVPTAAVESVEQPDSSAMISSSPVPTAAAESVELPGASTMISSSPVPTAATEAVGGIPDEAIMSNAPDLTEAAEPVDDVDDMQYEPLWGHLNGDVLQTVFQKLSCQDAIAASGVCKYWKSVALQFASLQDRVLLEALDVRLNEQKPFRSGLPCPENMGLRLLGRLKHMQVPRLIQVAADSAGNGTACMLCANVCEIRGDYAGAVRMWKRAAKAQQPIAMYKLGHHLYKGDMNTLGRNVEDAVMWLTRFQRHVSENLYSELAACGWAPEATGTTSPAAGQVNNAEAAAPQPLAAAPNADEAAPEEPQPAAPNQIAIAGPDPQITEQRGPDRSIYATGGHIYFRGNRAIAHPSRTSLRARLQAAAEQRQQRAQAINAAAGGSAPTAAAPAAAVAGAQQPGSPGNVPRTSEDQPAQGAPGNVAPEAPGAQNQPQGPGVATVRPAPPPRLKPESEKLRRMLVDALIILGYLHLDGEGTKKDNKEAVNAMRRAAELGSDEAKRTLGWMYNTGQFGE